MISAESYQPLFDLMHTEHGLTLTESEMDEIIYKCEEVIENFKDRCDVLGCNYVLAGNRLLEYLF